ncbi:MAG: Eco57I restriction-modification methylase domain-containing protein [Candidatus Symbiothrix sp.]|jgi:hypothetical protein|nr:Eco57I restriction-modification methylase domain-containing protein [Candidatus Symbiothrix sp.]
MKKKEKTYYIIDGKIYKEDDGNQVTVENKELFIEFFNEREMKEEIQRQRSIATGIVEEGEKLNDFEIAVIKKLQPVDGIPRTNTTIAFIMAQRDTTVEEAKQILETIREKQEIISGNPDVAAKIELANKKGMQNNNINLSVLNGLIIGRVKPHIYAFSTETVPNYLKVGDTYRPIEVRLKEWRKCFPNLEKQFAGVAEADDETFFRDFAVHYFLENERQKQRLQPNTFSNLPYFSNEFFENTQVQDVKDAIIDIKDSHSKNNGKYQFYRFDTSRIPVIHTYSRTEEYPPRPNQQETIDKFKLVLQKGRKNLLMYAVMRFGKSFTSMCCATEIQAKVVVIVSAKADVKEEWKKTVESHIRFADYDFLDGNVLLTSDTAISKRLNGNKKVAIFLTLQDLQGGKIKDKHKELFDNQIDLLIIDETHFGVRASEYGKVLQEEQLTKKQVQNELKQNDSTFDELETTIKELNAKIRLHLSGTPYRILMGSEFADDEIIAFYQFSDIAEDQEKWNTENLNKDDVKEWDNPYYGFPQMVRFAFNPNESSRKKMEELKQNGVTYAFSALFKPKSIVKDTVNQNHKKFEHEKEILDLLEVIDGSKSDKNLLGFLDYNKIKDGNICRHIVCVLPYRASCDALEHLITNNSNKFKNLNAYEIINIAGVDNERQYRDTQAVKSKIKSCEAVNKKTITLTVNRMLTGSTVEEWDTMLYFKDTASPQEYDQAIFRLQNQYIKIYTELNGDVIKYNMKPQTLLVDFDPNRMFRMQEEKSKIYNVNVNTAGNNELKERIKRELQISPIVWLNHNKIEQVTESNIIDAVRKYSANKSVIDEATDIPVDFTLKNISEIYDVISKEQMLNNSKKGLETPATVGEGNDLDIPTDEEIDTHQTRENPQPAQALTKEEEDNFKKQFQSYYSKILFFAFLTKDEVKSLKDILHSIKHTPNKRIAYNLGLNPSVCLKILQNINPFYIQSIDCKIENINELSTDRTLTPIDRVKNATQKFNRLGGSEIITPFKTAQMLISSLPKEEIINIVESGGRILDLAGKFSEFIFPLYEKLRGKVEEKKLQNCFYVVPSSTTSYEFSRKVFDMLNLNINNIAKFTSYDLLNIKKPDIRGENTTEVDFDKIKNLLTQNKPFSKIKLTKNIIAGGKNMKFDVVIGNPPYQENISKNEGNKSLSKQIFPNFVKMGISVASDYCSLITPTRWFTADAQDNSFPKLREFMKKNNHVRKFVIREGRDVFPMVTIPGTVGYFLYDRNHNENKVEFDESDGITKSTRPLFEEGLDIILDSHIKSDILNQVIANSDEAYLTQITTGRDAFGFSGNKNFVNNHSERQPFANCAKLKTFEGTRYIRKDVITNNREIFENYKVFISKADGAAGLIGDRDKDGKIKQSRIIGKNEVAGPFEACTDTYIPIGKFDNITEAENLSKYLRTKFLRFMVGIMKTSQNIYQIVYKFVPMQNFSVNSDIDWTKSIKEIDEQLYNKYKLSDTQIKYVDSIICEMK